MHVPLAPDVLGDVASYQGSALASWRPLVSLLAFVTGVAVVAVLVGRPTAAGRFERAIQRLPHGLGRIFGLPPWVATGAGLAVAGILVAGEGFYSDVAWHVALGRDEELFTAPHTSIVVGLVMIALAAPAAALAATVDREPVGFRLGGLRVPWSALPLGVLGAAAVLGFPLDEVWHQAYGIDVTMWSPTHMLMILGAAFTPVAAWLVLGEGGVRPTDSRRARAAHVVVALLCLLGLAAPMGEFSFGVPQFQALYHPVVASLAGGFALVAMRLVLGRGWALGSAVALFALQNLELLGDGGSPVETRPAASFLAAALVVELAAWTLGTEHRRRFALAAGLSVGTVGLAGEWWWNQGAHQPWRTTLLPEAVVLGILAATGAAVLGVAFAAAVRREAPLTRGINGPLLAVATVAVVATLAWPLPRRVGDVTADLTLEEVDGGTRVQVTLDPPDAAEDARWFQTKTWQGGGLTVSHMEEVGPGRYVSEHAHTLEGSAKTMVRLHRGAEMMAIPVYFPEDPEIGEAEIPAVDRTDVAFEGEGEYLLREFRGGAGPVALAINTLWALGAVGWGVAFAVAARHVGRARAGHQPSAPPSGPRAPERSATEAEAPAGGR